ncbi:MAG: Na+/H+ antiporter subunit E [Candidatus Hydrothermarchaeales archaeon]
MVRLRSKGIRDNSDILIASAILFLFWMFVSSTIDLQHVFVGILSALLIATFSRDLLVQRGEKLPRPKVLALFLFSYVAHFIFEIIKANIQVARIVLDPKMPISPGIVKFETKLRKDITKVTLANSITLTPGTLTVDLINNTYYVHALTTEAAEGVKKWHMKDRLEKLEAME